MKTIKTTKTKRTQYKNQTVEKRVINQKGNKQKKKVA